MKIAWLSLLPLSLFLHANVVAAESPGGGKAKTIACYGCHPESKIKSESFLHGPVNIDACETCHTPHNGKTKTALRAQGKELCFACHDDSGFRGKVAHAPATKGCVGCHSPHGGKTYSLLATSVTELCQSCHFEGKQSATHKQGDCTSCHDPHSSKRANLLKPKLAKGICKRTRKSKRGSEIAAR